MTKVIEESGKFFVVFHGVLQGTPFKTKAEAHAELRALRQLMCKAYLEAGLWMQ
jgi:hypothetical protein